MPLTFYSFNGHPGAGKDTHAEQYSKLHPGSRHISLGEIIRGVADRNTDFSDYEALLQSEDIEKMRRGDFLDPVTVVSLVKASMDVGITEGVNTFIYTGFPRNNEQLYLLRGLFNNFKGEIDPRFVLIDITAELAWERMEQRVNEALARGELPRHDDEPEVFANRMKKYKEGTEPMIQHMRDTQILIRVDGDGPIPAVFERLCSKLHEGRNSHPERR